MILHADSIITKTIGEQRERFNMLFIYKVLHRFWSRGRQSEGGCSEKRQAERTGTDLFTVPYVLYGVLDFYPDFDLLAFGLVVIMWTEKANDGKEYRRIVVLSDFDKFKPSHMSRNNIIL